ncbi:MAG: hypothetical protein KGK14_07820 [Bacteroidota bacterium]|nr:hypothetical protein [Bacteroidota bacterium]
MSNLKEEIDDIFKKHINDMLELPDEIIWKNISSHLMNEVNRKYKRKFLFWRGATGIAALLFIFIMLTFTMNYKKQGKQSTYLWKRTHLASNLNATIIEKNTGQANTVNIFNRDSISISKITLPKKVFNKQLLNSDNKNFDYAVKENNKSNQEKNIIPFSSSLLHYYGVYRTLNSTSPSNFRSTDSKLERKKYFPVNASLVTNNYTYKKYIQKQFIIHSDVTLISPLSIDVDKKNKLKHIPISLSLVFSPYLMNYFNNSLNTVNQYGSEHQGENNEISYSFGLLAKYKNKNWEFSTGLQYSQSFISIRPKTIYATQNTNGVVQYKYFTSSGYAYLVPAFSNQPQVGDSLYTSTAKHTLQYFSVPLRVGYIINANKWSIIPTLGTTVNILKNATIETVISNGVQSEQEILSSLKGLKNIYFSVFAGTTIQYQFHSGIAMFITPNFQLGLQSITNKNISPTNPYQGGVEAGVNISF